MCHAGMPAYRHSVFPACSAPPHIRCGPDVAMIGQAKRTPTRRPTQCQFGQRVVRSSRSAGSREAPRTNSASNERGLIATQESAHTTNRGGGNEAAGERHVTRASPRAQSASPPSRQGRVVVYSSAPQAAPARLRATAGTRRREAMVRAVRANNPPPPGETTSTRASRRGRLVLACAALA